MNVPKTPKQQARQRYYKKNGERTRHERRNQYQEQKEVVIRHYGGECEACGERESDVLTVDHINGDGAEHRKEVPASQIHAWLIRNEFPPGFRILCFNCNHRSRRSIERSGRPMQTIRNLQREVSAWADSVYPNRTLESVIGKLREEYQELMDALQLNGRIDPLELADVLILALDGATLARVDVQNAVREKVGINYERSWLIDPKTGLMSHRKDGAEKLPEAHYHAVFEGGPLAQTGSHVIPGEAPSASCPAGHTGPGAYLLARKDRMLDGRTLFVYKWDPTVEVPF